MQYSKIDFFLGKAVEFKVSLNYISNPNHKSFGMYSINPISYSPLHEYIMKNEIEALRLTEAEKLLEDWGFAAIEDI